MAVEPKAEEMYSDTMFVLVQQIKTEPHTVSGGARAITNPCAVLTNTLVKLQTI